MECWWNLARHWLTMAWIWQEYCWYRPELDSPAQFKHQLTLLLSSCSFHHFKASCYNIAFPVSVCVESSGKKTSGLCDFVIPCNYKYYGRTTSVCVCVGWVEYDWYWNKEFRSLVHGLRGIVWFWAKFWTGILLQQSRGYSVGEFLPCGRAQVTLLCANTHTPPPLSQTLTLVPQCTIQRCTEERVDHGIPQHWVFCRTTGDQNNNNKHCQKDKTILACTISSSSLSLWLPLLPKRILTTFMLTNLMLLK